MKPKIKSIRKAPSHRYHRGQDRGVVEEGENLVSEGCLAHRNVGYVDVGDGKARTDRKGKIGKVALLGTLLAREGEPTRGFLGSIVEVSVVESVRSVKYSPGRDHS
jgi:hypothetical protein